MEGWKVKIDIMQYLQSLPDIWWEERYKDWLAEISMQEIRRRLFGGKTND